MATYFLCNTRRDGCVTKCVVFTGYTMHRREPNETTHLLKFIATLQAEELEHASPRKILELVKRGISWKKSKVVSDNRYVSLSGSIKLIK